MKKKPVGFLRVFGAAALVIGLLAATMAPVMAQDDAVEPQNWLDELIGVEGAGFLSGNNAIFYPWVANDDDFGLGPADTSISVQNLEDEDTVISIFVGDGAGDYTFVTSAYLAAYAAKTFSAEMLGMAPGEGAPVMVTSFNAIPFTFWSTEANFIPADAVAGLPSYVTQLVETPVILSNPITADEDGGESTQVIACVVNYFPGAPGQPGLGSPWGYVDAQTGAWVEGPHTQQELQEILNDAQDGGELVNPFGGLNNDGDCFDVLDRESGTIEDSVAIGGTALQTATAAAPGVPGDDDDANGNGDDNGAELEQFVTTHTATSGYNAVNGAELSYFGEWYLPIVQTNCGPGGCWDSVLRIANFDGTNNAVTVRFFPADDGSGSLQAGFQLQALIDGGDTWHINLGDYVPEGWVGSAHILTDGAAYAMVDRYKVGYNMWITNTGSSADFENVAQVDNAQGTYALFAPHVLMDYFGWNTGINVANLADTDNNISIQYFNMLGNATQVLSQRLAAHGMTYFYDPSINAQNISEQDVTTDPNAGVVGSAIIWSDFPVAAAVDATKYPETDPTGGADLFQATSYNATQNVFTWQAVPYVTKGNPTDGSGATSGINMMNPNSDAVTANVYWVNPSGFNAQNFGVSGVTIPGFANGFVYTLWQQNLPNGFLGAAQVVASGPIAAVSANVNYDVEGDGSAIFNAFNPCGFYRTAWPCTFGDVFEPGGQSVTKTFVDQFGDPVQGVTFQITSAEGSTDFPFTRDGVSGTDGSRTFTNVPVGVYDLYVTSTPAGYATVDPLVSQETFTVTEGDDVVLENVLELLADGFTKTVVAAEFVPGGEDDDDSVELTTLGLGGVNVVVSTLVGTDGAGDPVFGDVVLTGTTDETGVFTGSLIPGDYVLCIEAGTATTAEGDVVDTSLTLVVDEAVVAELDGCDVFTIGGDDDDAVALVNGLFISEPAATTGGIDVITTTTTVDNGGVVSPEGNIDVVLYLLAEGETCGDVTLGAEADFTGTTNLDGELSFTDLEPGVYCIIGDLDDDGFDAGDPRGEVTVEAGVVAFVQLDLINGFGMNGTLFITATVGGDPAPGTAVARVYAGACADLDLDATVLFVGDGLAAGATTGTLPLGDYCVVVDTAFVDGEVFDVEGQADVVVWTGTNNVEVSIDV